MSDRCDNCKLDFEAKDAREMFGSKIVCVPCYKELMRNQKKPLPYASPAQPSAILTELTAKRWKKHQLAALALCMACVLMIIFGMWWMERTRDEKSYLGMAGFYLLPVGLVYFLWARMMAWWHHG